MLSTSAVTGSIFSYARVAALAFALIATGFVVTAAAQTMGEYGGVTANGAAAASSMPKIGAPRLGNQENSAGITLPGPSQTEEIRTYEAPSIDRSRDDKDTDTDSSHDEWEQVK